MSCWKWCFPHRLRKMAALVGGATVMAGLPTMVVSARMAEGLLPSASILSQEALFSPPKLSQRHEFGLCPSQVGAAIDTIVRRPQLATARWGIAMEPLATETVLYTHRAEDFLIPASNIKLFTTAAALHIVAERSPQTLSTVAAQLEAINRHSNNAQADAMLRTIGGQHAVRTALSTLGVNPEGYQQVDGSGLSRSNQAKPAALLNLLKAMPTTDGGQLFYNSLPVGGVNGTLRNRFKGTSVQGAVHAKTGTLRGVRALSGYLETPGYGTVVFSIMVNQPGQSGRTLLRAIDDMVLNLAQVRPCE